MLLNIEIFAPPCVLCGTKKSLTAKVYKVYAEVAKHKGLVAFKYN